MHDTPISLPDRLKSTKLLFQWKGLKIEGKRKSNFAFHFDTAEAQRERAKAHHQRELEDSWLDSLEEVNPDVAKLVRMAAYRQMLPGIDGVYARRTPTPETIYQLGENFAKMLRTKDVKGFSEIANGLAKAAELKKGRGRSSMILECFEASLKHYKSLPTRKQLNQFSNQYLGSMQCSGEQFAQLQGQSQAKLLFDSRDGIPRGTDVKGGYRVVESHINKPIIGGESGDTMIELLHKAKLETKLEADRKAARKAAGKPAAKSAVESQLGGEIVYVLLYPAKFWDDLRWKCSREFGESLIKLGLNGLPRFPKDK